MNDVRDERRATDVGRIVIARRQIEMLGQCHDADGSHAGGEERIDVLDRQSGIGERATRALGMDLIRGLVRRPAGGMLVHAGDHRIAESAHWLNPSMKVSIAALNWAGCSLDSVCPASSITTS